MCERCLLVWMFISFQPVSLVSHFPCRLPAMEQNCARPKRKEDTDPVSETALPERGPDPGRGAAGRKSELGGEPRDIENWETNGQIMLVTLGLAPKSGPKDALAERSKAVAQGAIP